MDFLKLNLKNLLPTISKPTRVTTKSATLIDNIFISTKLQQDVDPLILLNDISDHMPCMVTLYNQKKSLKESKKIKSRRLTDNTIQKINNDINTMNWSNDLTRLNAEDGFNMFHDRICALIDTHAPETEKIISAKKVIKDPWITKGLLTSLNKQRKLYTKMLTESSKETYKIYRNKLKSLIRTGKRKYLHEKCTEYKQDSRKLWQLINKMIGKENNKTHTIESIRSSDALKYDAHNITNTFNEFFSTIGEKYAEKLKSMPMEANTLLNKINQNSQTLFLQPCTPTEIGIIITELPYKTSSGHDNISNVLLKKTIFKYTTTSKYNIQQIHGRRKIPRNNEESRHHPTIQNKR